MNNPPAFPVTTGSDGGCINEGMTLRDYFAAAVVTGMMANDAGIRAIHKMWPDELAKRIAIGAFTVADAMLEQREQAEQ